MTVIEDAPQCTVRRELAGAERMVPIDEVFPGWNSGGFAGPSEVVPGRDAADPARCPGELPTSPFCDEMLPWTGLLFDAFVTASGARRVVDGYLLAMPHGSNPDAPPEQTPGTRVVTYRLLDLAAGDPKGAAAFLDRSFRSCAGARPATSSEVPGPAGVKALIGTARSDYRAPAAQLVLLRRGSHLVWAVLDGGGWKTGERAHAVQVLAAHLL
ncbi:hypothetical protein FHX52_2886 [Humibacillus xanthopallidus]|uniref:PknH-like protein n=1 Tax=Humibacillus xanthopallidus TaxID=412689 RepID=A0A543PQ24_9MICO|nr:hypothetical protein [Humibacillus xanthopallidus]TQN46180.1 hypothetical protein FHX52_2886 [Humibacillus xanthopallidus]